jgi:glycosyltransferase involved in cell wall biosynthesis
MHGSGGRIDGQGVLGSLVRAAGRRLAGRLSVRAYSAAPAGGAWQTLLHASPRLAGLEASPVPASPVPVFLWIGRLDAPKQPEKFVEACALVARHTPVRGVMLGDGPLSASVRSRVAELGAPVDVLGTVDDVAAQLDAARALCLFSDFEGVPFAVQEAMWVGRPVVLSPLPSLSWFAGGASRYARDVSEAAAAMLALTDTAVAAREGAVAAERIRSLLTADAPFPQLLADYREAGASTDR